ncbi:MAG: UDP-N-acetylenolpyruvoylglucosamine reductase [Candidatus Marinimicrobia bacterium]|nr:UDP-N-acetylenolpyruvoylglucosamine reductase [Candidatus Neomarinimicrobiota bacterium]
MNKKHQNYILENYKDIALLNAPMDKHTTFGVGGYAKVLLLPNKLFEVKEILKYTKKHSINVFFTGSGSNILVSKNGFNGIVVSLKKAFKNLNFLDDGHIICGAGVMLGNMVREAMKRGIKGLESLSGVPGTLGGALYMNAGAYGSEISNFFVLARMVNMDGEEKIIEKKDVDFSYRKSSFPKGSLLFEAKFKCFKGDLDKIKEKKMRFSNSRRNNQPLRYRSAGSVFKNPSDKLAAGYLIEKTGLKGISKGGAMISDKHANFIVNLGGANSDDVLFLINLIRKKVYQKFNVLLELEIKLVGFDAFDLDSYEV